MGRVAQETPAVIMATEWGGSATVRAPPVDRTARLMGATASGEEAELADMASSPVRRRAVTSPSVFSGSLREHSMDSE